ncbi:MAG: hypothetical protein Q8L96_06480 [Hylemonella sp.]|nr:hypothetical protein [Hylemonella sp.]
MTMKYSASTGGFYDTEIHGNNIPTDAVGITIEQHATLLAGQSEGKSITADQSGFPVLIDPAPPTAAQIEAAFTAAIQQRLDDFARTRNYDSILSACTYATSTVAKFKTEGQACVNLRDATWAAAYQILADVQAGDRPMPASIADIEADLPALEWPQ